MNRIKKGDEVIVIAGKDKGRRGAVTKVLADGRVVVENVNVVKKHQRGNPNGGVPGGIIEKEAPLNASNVQHYNSASEKAGRIGYRHLEDGRKVRYFRSNDEVLDA